MKNLDRMSCKKNYHRHCALVYYMVLLDLTNAVFEFSHPLIRDSGNSQSRQLLPHRLKRSWVWNQFFVLEEYTGTEPLYVGKLHSDMDNGDGSIKYILSGDGAGTMFTIDDGTGDIHAIQRLDREERSQYTLRAQALDRSTNKPMEPESEFIIKIQDINDNEPKFLDGPYTASVAEMSPVGTSIIQVSATDADDPTYGSSARVVYSILQGQPYFSVDSKTGVIRTALTNMDRESREYYEVIIQAKDMGGQLGGLAGTTSVNITLSDVNDNPPRFPQKHYQMNVLESSPVNSTVGRVLAMDLDEGVNAEMKYSIIDGDGFEFFDIVTDPSNQVGVITVKKPLDFENKKSYTLKIEGSNPHLEIRFLNLGPFRDTTSVHISVEDVDEPPVFESNIYFVEVSENVDIGTTIQIVSAKDPDATNNSVRYSIDRNSDPGRYFYVDVTTGALMTARPLDREEVSWHNITILAMEMNNPKQIGGVPVTIKILDVNDNAPTFTRFYETLMCENAKADQLIQTVSAVDQDDPQEGQHISYSLAPEAANNPNFTLRDNQVLVLLILSMRRHRKQPYTIDEEDNVHENIVRYDDEGGGEEDTEAFDIAALWNPREVHMAKTRKDMKPEIESLSRYVTQSCRMDNNVHSYMLAKLYEADTDVCAPPFDSLQTYMFEGEGSVAQSLSSLQSLSTDSEQSYDYLTDWGPRFKKLAEMYGTKDKNGSL
eukprot:XP_017950447.1 PREDICTED: cadherin-20 isoform X3 [Xenopus tropicalis]